mmetsp:Transcript_10936/g.45490  ORF Transcript_10936/g.45490 Transcript_10936/m.45490 type:complete len:129 (+) Transcript_10936:164-550(+)
MDGLGFIPGSWSLVKGNSRSARTAGRCQMSEVSPTSYRVNLGPLEVSPLGVGAWSWGDDFYWGKGDENDEKQAFDASLAGGINFFDTAEIYAIGESERRCGRFKRSYLRRKEVGEEGLVWKELFLRIS